jgi:glycosyltransferase involved in cell wall biosynthesis
LIVIQRVNSNLIYSNLLKILIKIKNSNTVYDLDDADYLEHPPSTIYYFIKNCSAVYVGSKELQRNLSHLNNRIILNTSPTLDLKITKQGKNGLFTIGWIGDFKGGHKEGLVNLFFPALKDLPFKIKLILLGVHINSDFEYLTDYFKRYRNVQLEIPKNIDWQNEREIQNRITKFDIGIATLFDNELHRSKSAFKLKQYFNNGIPVLSSAIPENSNFVEEGRNGFYCETSDDFRKRIIEINDMSPSDYNNLSFGARSGITKFNLKQYTETLISNFES